MQVYGCVVALPGYYHEAIDTWNLSNPNTPFVECSGDSLTIHPYDDKLVPDITMDMVTQHLICHGIPPQWIDHVYTFGLHHLNHHSHLWAGPFHKLYCNTNCKQLQRLDIGGEPVAIPQWDSWWCPTYHDITRIQYLMSHEDDGMGKS